MAELEISKLEESEAQEQLVSINNALANFKTAAERVPAYKKFLESESVDPSKIKTIDDFEKFVPLINKDNYLRKYPLNELCLDGNLFTTNLISSSSGSSGKPFFWPRGNEQHEEATKFYKDIYEQSFGVKEKKSLIVVCFSMGTWIAGTYTLLGSLGVANLGHNINVATPGIDKADAINVIKDLGDYYDQIIIAGYPPFIKDVIDLGEVSGIDWKSKTVKFSFAGEAISEQWRDQIIARVGGNIKPTDTANIYGTADAGIIGFETPLSITLRRAVLAQNESEKIFNNTILPSLVQYDASRRYFEEIDNELIFTAPSGIPLIRYNIRDNGGVMKTSDFMKTLKIDNFDNKLLENNNHHRFVYINGRNDFAISFYALLIYPENIKVGLESEEISKYVSGKFIMKTEHDEDLQQVFKLIIELKPNVIGDEIIKNEILKAVTNRLIKNNAEYRKLHTTLGKQAEPNITLMQFNDKEYFDKTNKHKWVE